MNGAAPWRPPLRKYTPRIAGHTKSSSGLGLKRPVITKPKPFKQPVDLAKFLWVCLLVTLGVDCLLALALAGGQFLMPPTFFGTLAATTLLAIGIANGWALNSVRRSVPTWARDAFIGQVFVLFLAGYVIVTDVRSPTINWYVMVTAVLVLAVAFLWFIFLAPKSEFEWTKTALIVTALLPLAGLLQFWLQNYYIPSTSMPLVDISTELSPQGWSGPIIHLSAKATIHNRGTSAVNVAGSLIRVTAYPLMVPETTFHLNPCWGTSARNEDWCRLANGFDPSGIEEENDFRVNPALPGVIAPTRTSASQLLYAATPRSEFLMGGATDIYQRDVDIDSRNVLLARLTARAIFLTGRRIENIRACAGKRTSEYEDFRKFVSEARQVQQAQTTGAHYFCREYDIASGNFIEKLIANHPAIQVSTWLNNPYRYATEHPLITAQFGTVGGFDQVHPRQQLERHLEEVYPASVMTSESEYAPTEKSLPSPAPPSGNG
jgi:heme/copper-type cytochrome/quinol oxidase subunit 4